MAISPSPTPHAIATLHTVAQSDAEGVAEGKYGNDVMVWGKNVLIYSIGAMDLWTNDSTTQAQTAITS